MDRQTATERDLRLLERILDPDRPTEPAEDIAQSLLEDVAELVPCEAVILQVMDYPSRYARTQSTSDEEEDPALDRLFWEDSWDCLACSYPQRTGRTDVARASDFAVNTSEYLFAVGVRHDICVPLPLPDRFDHRLVLFRETGPDFTERDRLLMTLLQPHVTQMHARQPRRQHGTPELTPRQWEILRLVAAGCTNRQVARAVRLTERTSASTWRTSTCAWAPRAAPKRSPPASTSPSPSENQRTEASGEQSAPPGAGVTTRIAAHE